MTNRTWIGGGNNKADNPKLWDPAGVPQSDDRLFVSPGIHTSFTMNVTGHDIGGVAINGWANLTANLSHQAVMGAILFGATATFNMSQTSNLDLAVYQGAATVDITGDNTLSLFVSSLPNNTAATVNLKHKAIWTGHLTSQNDGNTITVNGGADTTFNNDNTTSYVGSGSFTKIDANVLGNGAFGVGGGHLEFMQAVGLNQTIDVNGFLQIDRPDLFAGSIILDKFPPVGGVVEIDLLGLANADSYTYKNDLLSIFGAGKVIDALHLTDATLNGFAVVKTTGSVNLVPITDPSNPPIGLPIHV